MPETTSPAPTRRSSTRTLSLGVGLAAASWGLFWLPMRALEGLGLQGAWASVGLFTAGIAVMLPLILWRRGAVLHKGWSWIITGLITGSAYGLYATALLFTDVVHTLLLFYLTPVWSTLLGWLFLGEHITKARLLALAMGIAGLAVVLDYTHGLPLPRNIGDWMALLSGIGWAYGSVRVFGERYTNALQPTFAYNIGGVALGLGLVLLLPGQLSGAAPSTDVWLSAAPWLALMTAAYLLPTAFLLFLGTMRLSPGRIGILMMGEALVGVLSAALLADEQFGLRESIGALLIVGASFVEVMQPAAEE